ncbi:Uncharacterised protein [Salmonella enterica subsp. enterica serovar Typhi]|nr:Uncharacterised protein [Salmonella enterica subsp. enterica serovar Typhi]
MLALLNRRLQSGKRFLTFITRLFQLRLLSALFIQQRLLLALLLFQLGFLRGDLFASLFQFGDSLLARLVQIAEVGLQALPTLALFSAKNKLNAGVFALAESGVQLRSEITLLAGFLLLQFGN